MGDSANVVIGPATISFDGSDLGFTKDGVRLRMEREYVDAIADQFKGVIKKVKSLERFYVATTLLEATRDNLMIAWDQPSGSLGSNGTDEKSLEVVGPAPSDKTRTFTLQKAVSLNDGELNYTRDEESALEVEFECLKQNDGTFGSLTEA